VSLVHSFPPIAAPGARVLILGSMPGAASLAAGQYYAHPRNLFWPIMGALFDAGPERPYGERVERLRAAGVAVWDVLASCVRPGSLDTAIERSSAEPNDFRGFLSAHPEIDRVFFNGTMAEQSFRRLVLPRLPRVPGMQRLPSSSPAHAARSFEEKLQAWRAVAHGLD
jgi:double-stranded uracil-DNA glycosylase